MKDLVISGNIYDNGRMVRGAYSLSKERFLDSAAQYDLEGTLIRAPVNFHTHLGDSFIGAEPEGSIKDIVGPGGLKIRELEKAPAELITKNISKSIDFMKAQGTLAFFDFRESGLKGLKLAPRFSGISGFFLTRPSTEGEILPLLDMSAGFGVSAISDYQFSYLSKLSNIAHSEKKLFALHFSEDKRERVEMLESLHPDYVIHCIETTDHDLSVLSKLGTPVVITPRSNVFHGKRPDYSRLFTSGLTVLLGTDNVFITEPIIMGEAEFLYRYQRKLNRLSPETVLSTIIENPRYVMKRLGLKVDEEKFLFYPGEFLTPYQIVTRPNYYKRTVISKKGDRISYISRKH